jgi:CBS domain-containing protein
MPTLHASDLMTTDVVTVPPATPVSAIARMFADRHLSAVAVTGTEGQLLGLVTASDLLRRLVDEDMAPQGWLARLFDSPSTRADRYARSHGVTAREVMTTELVTAGPEEGAAHLARLMEERRIRRVPVTEGGRLIGLVNRADLVRALLDRPAPAEGARSDERIEEDIRAAMAKEPWAQSALVTVHAEKGRVELFGLTPSKAVSRALCVLAENVPGVTEVADHTRERLGWEPG